MYKCHRCHEEHPRTAEFFPRKRNMKDGLASICHPCNRSTSKAAYDANPAHYRRSVRGRMDKIQAELDVLKSVPCSDCTNTFPPVCMDFDHLRDKEFGVSKMVRMGLSRDRIMAEVEKCEVVCSNCHRLRTSARLKASV